MRRTQIYLDEVQDRELKRRATAERTTKSALIRRAISRELEGSSDEDVAIIRWRAAIDGTYGTAPDLPTGPDYVDHVRALDADRDTALASHRGRRR
jgi:hypothetical protein